MNPIRPRLFHLALLMLPMLLAGCSDEFFPKPKGYIRIELPPHEYLTYDEACPFQFDHSKYAFPLPVKGRGKNACWINLHYPSYNATIHLSYHPVNGDLHKLMEDSRTLAMKHIPKATDIEESLYRNEGANVYGITYNFIGSTASDYQFFLTDSANHFIRGAMYFNISPNPDSLAPVSAYIKEDLRRFIGNFRWRDENGV